MTEYYGVKVEDIFLTMPERFKAQNAQGLQIEIGYNIKGEGAGIWLVKIENQNLQVNQVESLPSCSVTVTADADTFVGGTLGKVDLAQAISSGKLIIDGDMTIINNVLPNIFSRFGDGEETVHAEELISLQCISSIDQRFATGPFMGKWFKGLKEKKLMASRCPDCGRVQVPPREICAVCRARCRQIIEVGPGGVVANWDTVYYASPDPLTGKVRSTPYTTLYLWLDGTLPGEAFTHDLKREDIDRVKRGTRVRPVWSEHRTGSYKDLLYFEIDE